MKKIYSIIPPSGMNVGERIISEYGIIETIYGIENDTFGKYISTIVTDDLNFLILNTYFLGKKETLIKKIAEKKKIFFKNIEKATISCIEKEIGLNALGSQLN